MNPEGDSDPFTEQPSPVTQASFPAPPQAPPHPAASPPTGAPTAEYASQYAGAYAGAAGMQSTHPAAPGVGYAGMQNYSAGYNTNYGIGYSGAYGNPYSNPAYGAAYQNGYGYTGAYAPPSRQPPPPPPGSQLASGARETGAMVLSGMHEAMARFARVSSLIEEVLRNLHMLFDAIFGLGYSIGAFRQEAGMWLAVKTGPVAYLARLLRRAGGLWRMLGVVLMSPWGGRFSPVALVLRILGLVPGDDPLEEAFAEGRGGSHVSFWGPETADLTGFRRDDSNM